MGKRADRQPVQPDDVDALCLLADDIGFVLKGLRKYQGQPATHDVVKELVVRLPADDPRLGNVEISLQMTGVVSGEFGFVEAYTAKKAR
jgi:hypothetical protein